MLSSLTSSPAAVLQTSGGLQPLPTMPNADDAVGEFVGSVFFSQMMKALRSTQQEVAYIGGGQGEKIFQSQFDQLLVDQLSKSHGGKLAEGIDVRV